MSVMERKYSLARVAAGDYILPSNDGETIWRITKYVDGESGGLDFPDRDFWGAWKWTAHYPIQKASDPLDWDQWEQWLPNYDTRQEAIDAALGEEGR